MEALGRGEKGYEVYARQIREEYGHFSEFEYAKGRLDVLEKFLGGKDCISRRRWVRCWR